MTDPARKKSFLAILQELSYHQENGETRNGHSFSEEEQDSTEHFEEDESVLTDEIDHWILMHRDAHFGGDFNEMLHYYTSEESIGIHPDFDFERIEYLADIEKEMGQNLAPLILTGTEAEAVAQARHAYVALKQIYETDHPDDPNPRLLADLILSEEEDPEQEIEAIVARGAALLPALFAIVQTDTFYNPLFPGYGYAPYLAIQCIGKIKDPSGIIPLFESLHQEGIFDEMITVDALVEIGNPAKDFLMKILGSRPLTQDHTAAAFALSGFAHNPQIAFFCFQQLKDPQVQNQPLLRLYLVNNCERLKNTPYREEFVAMAQNGHLPSDMRGEMRTLIDEWGSH
jgi:hypothetical protein